MISPSPGDSDYRSLLQASKHLDSTTTQKLRLALLCDAATRRFVRFSAFYFNRRQVDAEIYEAPNPAATL